MTITVADLAVIVVMVYLIEGLRRVVWAFLNWVGDIYLRRNGWDQQEEYVPMVDYVPFWRLFTGVNDLEPISYIRKRI